MNKTLILAVMAIMIVSLAGIASAGNLRVEDVDAFLDGSKKSISTSGGDISNVEPGQTLKIKIKFENVYPSGKSEIEDVEVEGVLEDIDDGDDIDSDDDSFDIRPGRSKSAELEFDIPLIVDEGEYDLIITAEGRNESGATESANLTYSVEIDKDRHSLVFIKAFFDDDTLTCDRDTSLRMKVVNIGQDEEEDVRFRATSDELDLDYKTTFYIDAGDDPDDVVESIVVPITAGDDLAAGTYRINYDVSYNKDGKTESGQINLVVNDCEKKVEAAPVKDDSSDDEDTVVVEQIDTTVAPSSGFQDSSTGTTAVPVTTTSAKNKSVLAGNGAALLVGLLVVLVAVLLVVVVALVMGKKKRME